jgi:hypothetical protein
MNQIDSAGGLEWLMSGSTAKRWLANGAGRGRFGSMWNNRHASKADVQQRGNGPRFEEGSKRIRSLNQDVQMNIKKSTQSRRAKREANEKELSEKEKKQLKEDDKEFNRNEERFRKS